MSANFPGVGQGCFECAKGKTTTGAGTACEYCPVDFVMKHGATQCEQCTSLSPEKMVKIGATDCGDVTCRPDATRCLEQAETSQASTCTREGFGWSYTLPGMCDVCGRNFFSTRVVSSNGLVSFNRCEECPPHFYTSDIGMSSCLRCPDFHVRKPGDAACTLCAAGILQIGSPHALSVAFFFAANIDISSYSSKHSCIVINF